jgi:hypothetical protein
VTGSGTLPGYHPGDKGTVKQGPYPAPSGGHYDIAQMANHAGGTDFTTREKARRWPITRLSCSILLVWGNC